MEEWRNGGMEGLGELKIREERLGRWDWRDSCCRWQDEDGV